MTGQSAEIAQSICWACGLLVQHAVGHLCEALDD